LNNARYTGNACKETGKLKLEVRVTQQQRPLDHSPIRSTRKDITISPIEADPQTDKVH